MSVDISTSVLAQAKPHWTRLLNHQSILMPLLEWWLIIITGSCLSKYYSGVCSRLLSCIILSNIYHILFLLQSWFYNLWYTCLLSIIVTIMVRTPTLCIPDMLDRPSYFLISLSNLATSLITYGAPCITLLCSTFIATLLHIWRRPYPYFRISFIH